MLQGGERSSQGQTHVHVAPVAYMIIFGDALHNLIDGLSIGAAFTDSTLLGISVAVAVLCEELPHELGEWDGEGGMEEWLDDGVTGWMCWRVDVLHVWSSCGWVDELWVSKRFVGGG